MRPLFSARALRISKISSCLRMPVAPGTSSCLAILVSAPTLMSLSVESSIFSIFSGGAAVAAPFGLRAVRQPVDQFPQFVQSFARDRRDRQHGVFKNGFQFSHRADPLDRARACRSWWRRRRRRRPPARSHCQAARSMARPGCRASTSRSAATPHPARSSRRVERRRTPRRPRVRRGRIRSRAGRRGTAAARVRARRGRGSRAASCRAPRWCAPAAAARAR